MHILFLNPFQFELFPHPGLGYLKSYIQTNRPNYVTRFADLNTFPKEILDPTPIDVIAISIHSFSVRTVVNWIPIIKTHHPEARLICGGHHPSALPDQMLKIGFNQVVVGPGETALLEAIEGKMDPIIYGKPSPLDSLPFPDYRCQIPGPRSSLPIISSRGCPFSCSFCSSSDFWKRKWSPRAPEEILKELSFWLDSGVMTDFMFEDDNFTLDVNRAVSICQLIRKELLPRYPTLRWQCASRTASLKNEELCRELKSAGCFKVWLGVESGSQRILDKCQKGLSVQDQFEGIQMAVRSGLETMAQFIIGLIGESRETIEETKDFIRRVKSTQIGINLAWTLPNTDLYRFAKSKGFDDQYYLDHGVPYFTWENSGNDIDNWAREVGGCQQT